MNEKTILMKGVTYSLQMFRSIVYARPVKQTRSREGSGVSHGGGSFIFPLAIFIVLDGVSHVEQISCHWHQAIARRHNGKTEEHEGSYQGGCNKN